MFSTSCTINFKHQWWCPQTHYYKVVGSHEENIVFLYPRVKVFFEMCEYDRLNKTFWEPFDDYFSCFHTLFKCTNLPPPSLSYPIERRSPSVQHDYIFHHMTLMIFLKREAFRWTNPLLLDSQQIVKRCCLIHHESLTLTRWILDSNGYHQCCLLTANIACHENGIPKILPVKRRFVEKIALQKVNTSNICTKQYIIPFYPLHLSKFHIHDPIVFLQCGSFNETHI